MAVRWGIVSAGKISTDFVLCLNALPRTEHELVAVAARNLERAKQFAEKHKVTRAYGSYEELAKDEAVEVAYIGNLNPDHFQVSKLMLEAGKHVLCEKPMCMNLKETEELVAIARKNKRFLMEAIWSRFFPAYEQLRKEVRDGCVGTPNLVKVTFAAPLTNVDRVTKAEMGGSAVLDIGVYAVQFASMIFEGEKPEKITTVGQLNGENVDEVALVILQYSNNRLANLTITIRSAADNEATVHGPKGVLTIRKPFHAPTVLDAPLVKYEYKLPEVNGEFSFANSQGLTYEAQAVRDYLRKDLLESPLISLDESLVISHIMTEIRKQLGAK